MTPAVVLVRAGGGAAWERSLAALRAHLPGGVRLVELGDREPAEAASAEAPADVVLVDAPVLLGAGWLEGLTAAADSTAATVSPLLLEGEAAVVVSDAPRRHPRLPAEPVACRLVRRAALDLAGPLDEGFADRATGRGLVHVVADDVLALLPGAPVPPRDPEDVSARHERPAGPLERARVLGRRAADGLSVTIDGRALGPQTAGTQVQALALLQALERTGAARLRVALPPEPGEETRRALATMPGVETIDLIDVPRGAVRSAIVHRPYQVTNAGDLTQLRRLGHRVVVTHQDSILYHAAGYHRTAEDWAHYRRLTADALAAADCVIAISAHAARELLAEDLVEEARLRIVSQGTDHPLAPAGERHAPEGAGALRERPFLLCIGTDLRHKNRGFAIELVAAMRALGWDGALVLAGPQLAPGGSAAEERERLAGDPGLHDAVIDLGPVPEAAKAWLYECAAAVVYPTVVEGFGLIPFEAAAAGTPCLFAAQASLGELLPREAALLVPWDAGASAERALALVHEPAQARAQVERVRTAGERLTWDATAARVLELYEEVLRMPSAPGAAAAWLALEAEEARGASEGRAWHFRAQVGDTGAALVGEDGALPDDVQRALVALSRRSATRTPLFAALRLLRRLAPGRR